ncbi:MAG: cytochrome c biogenesis protein CcdA [Proteobacteria bacterium]|nr:cytochrome c biogenesis protein CcdA [Pseudomonadota bacterium]MBS0268698.1 cytochrome c biogenesis protein CcdA [Pseudomonadota bacterium]
MLASLALAFLAGVLSVLSPCVLPLIPIVMATAASAHRYGPFALSAGVAISFVAISLFVATVGFAIGLDGTFFRFVAASLLIVIGAILVVPVLQERFAVAAGPIANWADQALGGYAGPGIRGQFGVGLVLGAVWSPCVGPTLGAASLLAARGEDLGQVTLTLFAFGFGAVVPLLVLGALSRELLSRWRDTLASAGSRGKYILGGILILTGVAILTGFDKTLETEIVAISPVWLTELTTKF